MEQNIRRAEEIALEIWKMGAVAVCPHTNTRFFQGEIPNCDVVLTEGNLELLNRSDVCFMVPGWEESVGSIGEHEFCEERRIPVYHDLKEIKKWIDSPDAKLHSPPRSP
jgi:hypothetical protein